MSVRSLSPAECDEYLLVDESGCFFDQNGKPVDLEALAAQGKPPEDWTLKEVWDTYAERLGWTVVAPDPDCIEQVREGFTRAYPAQAQQIRQAANFALRRSAHIVRAAPRPRRREHHPRRRAASSPRRARAPGRLGDDEPSPSDLAAALVGERGVSAFLLTRERDREHELDRMIVAAVYRHERARKGRGHRFELPPSLREKS